MKKFVCTICGYVHEGSSAPDSCPQCSAPAAKFVEQSATAALQWADEHRIGVAKDVDPEIIEGLKMNFTGECTEVGMYLAMSRQADREGYPEIAEAYKRIAWEEAEHAAKFAELLGDVLIGRSYPQTGRALRRGGQTGRGQVGLSGLDLRQGPGRTLRQHEAGGNAQARGESLGQVDLEAYRSAWALVVGDRVVAGRDQQRAVVAHLLQRVRMRRGDAGE